MIEAPLIREFHARGAVAKLFRLAKRGEFPPEVLVEGPAGCVAGETLLQDPWTGEGRRFDELTRAGERVWVQTLDGPVLADPPFLKGFAPLYRVTLESGRSCLATADHRFLARDRQGLSRWALLAELELGMALLSESPAGAPRSTRTAEGSLPDCRHDRRSRDPRPPGESAGDQGPAPSRGDAHGHSRDDWLADAQGVGPANSRLCLASARPSTRGFERHSVAAPSDALQAAECTRLDVGSRVAPGNGERAACSFRSAFQSPAALLHRPQAGAPKRRSSRTPRASRVSRSSQPRTDSRAQWDAVQSIRYERTDFYFDLHVPGQEHYVADGIYSHNTGKSRGWGQFLYWLAYTYPNTRGLFVRKTRVSLTESFLVTWENEVVPDDDPVRAGPHRAHRTLYSFPNGTEIVVGGLDNPTRLYSTQFDWIYVQEAIELTLDEWERLHRALRNNRMPFQFLGGDTNPDAPMHWLNKRCDAGQCTRLLSRHADNPSLTSKYLERLSNLTGVRRARLYLGQWVSAEGQVWEEYDPYVHLLDRSALPAMRWYFGSVDWGFRAAGVLQVWGVDGDDRLYRVAEVYRTTQQLDWWADIACKLDKQYDFRAIVCDPSQPGAIEKFNDRLGVARGRDLVRIAREADNDLIPGLDQVRWGLSKDTDGKPRMSFVRDALVEGADPLLLEASKPTCTEQEIPSYVWLKAEDGRAIKEKPDPACSDHGCDATRYAAMFAWRKDLHVEPKPEPFAPGTFGYLVGTPQSLAAAKRQKWK